MSNLTPEDMSLFIASFQIENNPNNNIIRDGRIPIYVEYIKHLKYYADNNIDLNANLKPNEQNMPLRKKYQITNDDLMQINKLVEKIKNGSSLYRTTSSQIANPYHDTSYSTIATFEEKDDYGVDAGKFELLDQVSDAMDKYKKKMKKSMDRKYDWKKQENNKILQNDLEAWELANNNFNNSNNSFNNLNKFNNNNNNNNFNNCNGNACKQWKDGPYSYYQDKCNTFRNPQDEHSRYYNEGMNSERPQIDYERYSNPQSAMLGTPSDNIISKTIDKIYNELGNESTSDFDVNNRQIKPNMYSKKSISQPYLASGNRPYWLQPNDNNQANPNEMNLPENRFVQDIQERLVRQDFTKEKNPINKNIPEFGYQYLKENPNRAMDDRFISASTRMENKTYVRR